VGREQIRHLLVAVRLAALRGGGGSVRRVEWRPGAERDEEQRQSGDDLSRSAEALPAFWLSYRQRSSRSIST
jgi:hypothetical protein